MMGQRNFFRCKNFAVIGASKDRTKFGNVVLNWYLSNKLNVAPVNPRESEIEGLKCFSLDSLLKSVDANQLGVSIVTPPNVTEGVIDSLVSHGVRNIWIQPGAEHFPAIERARANGINVVTTEEHKCILVVGKSALKEALSTL